jgi:hypothetical protein
MQKYIKDVYMTKNMSDRSNYNEFYDWLAEVEHRLIKFELKERTEVYDDILVEALQVAKKDVNDLFGGLSEKPTGHQLHIAVGWFYKCDADRLVYVNDKYVYDIDWPKFKQLVWDKKDNLETQYSKKGTGTWNWVVPVIIIPSNIYVKKDNIWQIQAGRKDRPGTFI